jgi:predicted dehydrogenase
MGDSSLKAVMIGAGFFAGFHAEAWKRIAGIELVAVADTLPGRAQEFAAKFGIPRCYTDASAMLRSERADFADIVTRPDSHRELCAAAAQHCRAVICQQPMAPTLADCQIMVEDCARRGVRLLIHENWRWQPWYREAKRLIRQGRLGRVFHVGFRMRTGDGRGAAPYQVQPYFVKCGGCYSTKPWFIFSIRSAFLAAICNRFSAKPIASTPRFKARITP